MKIDCGKGYVYNPKSGRCVSADGDSAESVRATFGKVSRYGTCSGTVKKSSKGTPYCSKAKKKQQQKKVVRPTPISTSKATVSAPSFQQATNSLRLRLVESQLRSQIKKTEQVRREIIALRGNIQRLSQRGVPSPVMPISGKPGKKPVRKQQPSMKPLAKPVRRRR